MLATEREVLSDVRNTAAKTCPVLAQASYMPAGQPSLRSLDTAPPVSDQIRDVC